MKAAFLALLCSTCIARADSAIEAYPPSPHLLGQLIAAAERFGEPLKSQTYVQNRREYTYFLQGVSYLGSIKAPFGLVHLAEFDYVRSNARGEKRFGSSRPHEFLVFFDQDFKARGCWRIDDIAEKFSVGDEADGTKVFLGKEVVFDYAHLPPVKPGEDDQEHPSVEIDGRLAKIPVW